MDRETSRQRDFLAQIVRVPTDNPPGDCAAAAARATELLSALGFSVEVHRVPVQVGIRIDVQRIMLAEPLVESPKAQALISALRTHAERVFGVSIDTIGAPL